MAAAVFGAAATPQPMDSRSERVHHGPLNKIESVRV